MAAKKQDFTRDGNDLDKFQLGRNYTEKKKQIILALECIYEDYKKEGAIYTLSKYENKYMSRTYLRKLADLGIIKRLTSSKKNMQYEWNSGNNANFIELANRLLTESKSKLELKESIPSRNYSLDSTKVTLLLAKSGIIEEKIPELTHEIMKIFYPEK